MANINLLPSDFGPKGSVLKIAGVLKKLIVSLFFILLVLGSLVFGYVMFLKVELKKSQLAQENLKSSIKILEQTEQKLYLLKDRISKIKSVFAMENLGSDIPFVDNILSQCTDISFSDIRVLPKKIVISLATPRNASLGSFFDNLNQDVNFESVKVNSITFSPTAGYLVDLELTLK